METKSSYDDRIVCASFLFSRSKLFGIMYGVWCCWFDGQRQISL